MARLIGKSDIVPATCWRNNRNCLLRDATRIICLEDSRAQAAIFGHQCCCSVKLKKERYVESEPRDAQVYIRTRSKSQDLPLSNSTTRLLIESPTMNSTSSERKVDPAALTADHDELQLVLPCPSARNGHSA